MAATESPTSKFAEYDQLLWADPLPPVPDLERVFLTAMRTKRKDRVVMCARELGWLFSGFQPDPTL